MAISGEDDGRRAFDDRLSKRQRLPSPDESEEDLVTDEQSGSPKSSQSVKLQSSDVLDCPTCCEPLKRPIYQCSNGHLSCSSCCKKSLYI